MLESIARKPAVSSQLLIENQFKYIKGYFQQVYPYSTNELVLGAIKINNDKNSPLSDMKQYFETVISSSENSFTLQPLQEDNTSFLLLFPLRGDSTALKCQPQYSSCYFKDIDIQIGVCCSEESCS